MRRMFGTALAAAGATLAACAAPAYADALHAFCVSPTPACSDNGTNTPTATNPPRFGFWAASGPDTGTYLLDVLVPDNEDASPSSLGFAITSTNTALSGTASLFSTSKWNSGQLDSYLGISASPTNPIGAYLPSTQALDPLANGFYVYQVNLGSATLAGAAGSGPEFDISPDLPLGSYIVGFLGMTDKKGDVSYVATANSAALFETSPPSPPNVPEPASLAVLGTALLGLGLMRRLQPGR